MQIEGAIYPDGDGFSYQAWCQLVGSRPEFRQPAPRQARNPFTSEPYTAQPRVDVADVVVAGRVVGEVYWSMSDEPLVNVSIEPEAAPLAQEWAAAISGRFQVEPWAEREV
jgi:hypothetical protein